MKYAEPIRVLLLEDHQKDALLIRELFSHLELRRFKLDWVTSYDDGLAALLAAKHALCILDCPFSGQSGAELLREAREAGCQVPVILLTEAQATEGDLGATDSGAADCLPKDQITAILLERSIRYVLERKQAQAALQEQVKLLQLVRATGLAIAQSHQLQHTLQLSSRLLVEHLGAAFARIWTLCEHEQVLELQASAGLYTHLDGPHSRIPLGAWKIGRIAARGEPHLTNSVTDDPNISDHQWAKREGIVAFAGYPLKVGDRVVGVIGVFAREPFSDFVVAALEAVSSQIAVAIERHQAMSALRRSKARYRHLLETGQVIPWEMDLNTWRFTYVGPQAEQILGYPLEAWREPDFWVEHLHPEDRDWAVRYCLEASLRGEAHQLEYRMWTADGRTVWLRDLVSVVQGEYGPTAVRGFMFDITERKQAEQELQQGHALLHAVMEGTTDAVFAKDREGRYLMINTAGACFLGKSVEEVLGRHDTELFTSETMGQVLDGDRHVLATGETVTQEEQITAAGVTRTYLATKGPLRDAEGRVVGTVGISRDISDRKQVEMELLAANHRITTILESITDAFFAVDREWRFTYLNAEAERLLQRRRDELFGKNIWEEFAEAVPLRFYAEYQRAMRENVAVHFEEFYPPLSVWFEVHAYPSSDGVAVYFRDVTQRRQAEEALRASEERFRTMAESAPMGIFLTDRHGRGLYQNPLLQQLMRGMSLEDAYARWPELIHPEDRVHVTSGWQAAVEAQQPWESNHRIILADGAVRWLDVRVAPILDQQQVAGFVGMVHDVTWHKELEQALAESEERFRTICETAPMGIFLADPKGNELYSNAERLRQLGLLDDEARGMGWAGALHPEDRERVLAAWSAAAQRGLPFESSHRFLHPDGSVVWGHVRRVPRHDGGRLVGYVCTSVDLTESVLAEQRVRHAEERYRALVENSTDLITIISEEGIICYQSPASRRLGHDPEELVGTRLLDYLHPDDRGHWSAVLHEFQLAQRSSVRSEVRFRHKDRSWRTLECVASNQLNNPHLRGLVVHSRDITDQKLTEARKAALFTLGNSLNTARTPEEVARVVLGVADELLGWDACWLELTKRDQRVPRTMVRMDLIDGQRVEVPDLYPNLGPSPLACKALNDGPTLLLRTAETMPQPGQKGHLPFGDTSRPSASIMCVPIRSGDQEVGAMSIQSYSYQAYSEEDLKVLQALADHCAGALERTQGEVARAQLQQQLIQSQKLEALGRLAGGVAHDFNNMLSVINGYCGLLLGSLPAESHVRGNLDEINKAGERAAALTRQLLAFSRKQLLEPKVVSLNDVARNVDTMLRRLIGEDIELITLLDPQLYPVRIDPNQIEQVLLNLAVNARDAMPTGGKLVLRTRNAEPIEITTPGMEGGPHVALEVEDTGCGMTPEVLERIFEPFFTTKELGQGTGLGLATVFGIVKQSDGYLDVTSEPGVGTRFTIYLPRVEAEPLAADEFTPPVLPAGTETILLVEDEPMVRRLVREVLRRDGYTVLEATQGDDALRVAETYEGPIHLLLTDVVMPRMSGREVAERLTALRPEVQVLFMSGYTDDAVLRHGVAGSETELLTKPFTHLELIQRVRRQLDRDRRQAS